MKNYIKTQNTISLFLLFFLLTFTPSLNVHADESIDYELKTYSTYTHTDTEAQVYIHPYVRGTLFNCGNGSIGKTALGIIAYSASTVAHHTVDYLYVKATLQVYVNKQWVTVSSCVGTQTNEYVVYTGKTTNVGTSGAYYRIYTNHSVTDGIVTESANGYSEMLWV